MRSAVADVLNGDHEIRPLPEDDLDRILEYQESTRSVGLPAGCIFGLSWAAQQKLIDEAVLAYRARAALANSPA